MKSESIEYQSTSKILGETNQNSDYFIIRLSEFFIAANIRVEKRDHPAVQKFLTDYSTKYFCFFKS